MRSLSSMRSVLAVSIFVAVTLTMTGCQGNNAPSVEANPAQSEPALPLTQSNNKENENEQNEKQLNLYEELITDIIFVEYPVIAIVKDQDIRYPEWSQNEPPDEILHQFKVTLVESLKGDLPHSFTYYMILEDEPSTKAEVPYIVALCRVGDTFLAEPLVGVLPSDLPGLKSLMRKKLAEAEPADFGPEACPFDLELPD